MATPDTADAGDSSVDATATGVGKARTPTVAADVPRWLALSPLMTPPEQPVQPFPAPSRSSLLVYLALGHTRLPPFDAAAVIVRAAGSPLTTTRETSTLLPPPGLFALPRRWSTVAYAQKH